MNNTKLSIIIPAYNEEKNIGPTLNSLAEQVDSSKNLINKSLYQVVIVDNNSTDNTVEIAKKIKERNSGLNLHIINEKTQGIHPARISGFNYILENQMLATPFLASGDADVIFHNNWVDTVLKSFYRTGVDVLSNAGCFPHEFWIRVPNLVKRYIEEIGTIFFNPETVEWVKNRQMDFLFTEQIFIDFIRPVTDGCFAITKDAYIRGGGYTLEFWDKQHSKPVHGEGWRLVFQLERKGGKVIYINKAPYNSSPRRILDEPEKFLGSTSYSATKFMTDIRNTKSDAYHILNEYANIVDLEPVKKYIVDYYIILKCITKPNLIRRHPIYFGDIADHLYQDIQRFWDGKKKFLGKELFSLSNTLGDKYFDEIIKSTPRQFLK